ncbi:uncharacterized protein LOC115274562 [Suricata suricatta]|uniref:uncharacterized protein LOC115274562 n=1 Tax=Suricata suricatta TaxID=37032 RepID=UPI0011558DD8|nr:uncharacterized protein LOC115274562 [Suricata suricatta]
MAATLSQSADSAKAWQEFIGQSDTELSPCSARRVFLPRLPSFMGLLNAGAGPELWRWRSAHLPSLLRSAVIPGGEVLSAGPGALSSLAITFVRYFQRHSLGWQWLLVPCFFSVTEMEGGPSLFITTTASYQCYFCAHSREKMAGCYPPDTGEVLRVEWRTEERLQIQIRSWASQRMQAGGLGRCRSAETGEDFDKPPNLRSQAGVRRDGRSRPGVLLERGPTFDRFPEAN